MSGPLERRLHENVAGTPLAARVAPHFVPLAERARRAQVEETLSDAVVRGVARAATNLEAARFLEHRTALWPELASLEPGGLPQRATQIEAEAAKADPPEDLEAFLDEIRVLRRQESVVAAVALFGAIEPLEVVSNFLSRVAEAIVQRALRAAQAARPASAARTIAVIGMGKIGGREFTFHSDLDLVFLYRGAPEAISIVSRVAQRLIAYLATMTGAGVAYAVDARLRPSGQQGALVTTFEAFDRYQRCQARTWEHLALARARPLAGERSAAQACIDGIRDRVFGHRCPWPEVARMRARVERERSREGATLIDLKTGPGGMMDAEFLAEGALLELGTGRRLPPVPAIAGLLRTFAPGPTTEKILASHRELRRVEATLRWLVGRGVSVLRRDHPELPLVAELVEPALSPAALLGRIEAARRVARQAFETVVRAGSIAALTEDGGPRRSAPAG